MSTRKLKVKKSRSKKVVAPENGTNLKTDELPFRKFIGIKEIEAKPMTFGEYNIAIVGQLNIADQHETAIDKTVVDEAVGYMVKESNGELSWKTRMEINGDYRISGHLTFGAAVEAALRGKYFRRIMDNKGQFYKLRPGYKCNQEMQPWTKEDAENPANKNFNGTMAPIFIKCNSYPSALQEGAIDVHFEPWNPTTEDLIATDYMIMPSVEEIEKEMEERGNKK